ncbi:MAG: hypothetical protein DHS20C21_24030 [Gemmatimonadota bacterium]|nr:MAG: hypothetical protein DHS20C21_24030 [Gemmatimonadota bacterium]
MKRAVGYLRRSTSHQDASLGDQQKSIERYANNQAIEIIDWYTDDAISGVVTAKRQAFLKLIDDAKGERREWDHVLVYDVKRFGRTDSDEAGFYRFQLRQVGVDIIYVSENFKDDETGDLVRNMKQWIAQQESRDTSKVTLRGQISNTERGSWSGGQAPYGFDFAYHDTNDVHYQTVRFLPSGDKHVFTPDGTLNRTIPKGQRIKQSRGDRIHLVPSLIERVETIQRIFNLYLDGTGFRAIAERLNDLGIPSPRNREYSRIHDGHWAPSTIREIITNPAYRGDLVWNRRTAGKFHKVSNGHAVPRSRYATKKVERNDEADWIVIEGAHQPLVDPIVFDRAQRLRKSRERNTSGNRYHQGRAKNSPYMLSGLITCACCGHKFQGMKTTKGKPRKDGTKVTTWRYICGGYRAKGKEVCRRIVLRRDELEAEVLAVIEQHVGKFLAQGGRERLAEKVREVVETEQGGNPREEIPRLRQQMAELEARTDELMDSLTPTNREFVDKKLTAIKHEREDLDRRIGELGAITATEVDQERAVDEAMQAMEEFGEVIREGSIEEQKIFARAFIHEIVVDADELEARVYLRKLPLVSAETSGNSSFKVVAGTGFEPATSGL